MSLTGVFVIVAIGPLKRAPCTGTVPEAVKWHGNLKGSVEIRAQETSLIRLFSAGNKVYRKEKMEPMNGIEPLTY